MQPHLILSKDMWKKFLKKNDLAIDATCGNGHDTLFLTELCSVIGIDIQPSAIENTKKILEERARKAELFRLPHEKIDELILPHPPKLIVYNLGYLPRGDKKITTRTETTLISVQKGLKMLADGGALSIICYPGHNEGAREEKALEAWAATLSYQKWIVCHYKWLNRKGAPSFLWISSIS